MDNSALSYLIVLLSWTCGSRSSSYFRSSVFSAMEKCILSKWVLLQPCSLWRLSFSFSITWNIGVPSCCFSYASRIVSSQLESIVHISSNWKEPFRGTWCLDEGSSSIHRGWWSEKIAWRWCTWQWGKRRSHSVEAILLSRHSRTLACPCCLFHKV